MGCRRTLGAVMSWSAPVLDGRPEQTHLPLSSVELCLVLCDDTPHGCWILRIVMF